MRVFIFVGRQESFDEFRMWFFFDEEHYVSTSLTVDYTVPTLRDDTAVLIVVADSQLAENRLSFSVGRKFDQRFRVALGGLQILESNPVPL